MESEQRRLGSEMHVYTRLRGLALLAVICVVAACVSTETKESSVSFCSVGEDCRLIGTLRTLRGVPASVGVLDTETGCVPLALPQEVYDRYGRWNHRRVEVTGSSFAQPDAEDAVWFSLKDRQVASGGCDASPLVIYVTGIKKL